MGGFLALTIITTAHAQEKPYTQPGTAIPVPPPAPKLAASASDADAKPVVPPAVAEQNRFTNFFNGKIPEAIAKGKFNLNARLRYEWVDQSIHFGAPAARILQTLPRVGPLFPYLISVRAGDRATEFTQRCVGLGIVGVTLHSYRYAWAERARSAGYPERFAEEALGHNSKAVHRAYAKKAHGKIPALEDYEPELTEKVIQLKRNAA